MYTYEFDREDCPYLKVCNLAYSDKCIHSCVRYMEMDYLIYSSGLTKHQTKIKPLLAKKADVQAFKELSDIRKNIKEFVKDGQNLFIVSHQFGNGKTTWAIRFLLSYFDSIWDGNCFKPRGLFVNIPNFIVDLRNTYRGRNES